MHSESRAKLFFIFPIMILPEYKNFEATFVKGRNQIIYKRLAADLDTPVSLLLKLTSAKKNTFIQNLHSEKKF